MLKAFYSKEVLLDMSAKGHHFILASEGDLSWFCFVSA
jgi:hypothetical protein